MKQLFSRDDSNLRKLTTTTTTTTHIKQLLDEVEHDIINYQNRGLCYQPKPKAELRRGGGCFTLTPSVISSFLPKIRGAWISRAPPLKIYHCILSLLFMFPDKGFFI